MFVFQYPERPKYIPAFRRTSTKLAREYRHDDFKAHKKRSFANEENGIVHEKPSFSMAYGRACDLD